MIPGIFSYHGDRYVSPANRALIFAHIGQSNCGDSTAIAGRPVYLQGGPVAGVYIADRLKTGFAALEIGVNNNVETSHTTYGPEGELGYRLQAALSENIYILKLNKSGSAIDDNRTPDTGVDSWQYDAGELCAQYLDMIDWALTQSFGGKVPVFAGILWQQGEADAGANPETANYRDIWYQVINTIRARMGRMNVPVALSGISPTYSATRTYALLPEMAAADSSVYYLSSAMWDYKPDNVHLDDAGIAACGLAAANVFISILTNQPVAPEVSGSAIDALENLALHLDASTSGSRWQDAAGTIAAAAGDPVGRLDDLSGNGRNFLQPTDPSFRPVVVGASQNSLDTISLSNGDFLSRGRIMAGGETAFAFWYVAKMGTGVEGFETVFTDGTTDSWAAGFIVATETATANSSHNAMIANTAANVTIPRSAAWRVVTVIYDGADFSVEVDGVSIGSDAYAAALTTDLDLCVIGAYNETPNGYLTGEIGEIVYSLGAETSTAINNVTAELITKWGI